MKKRIISTLLTLAIALSLFTAYSPRASARATEGHFGSFASYLSDLRWEIVPGTPGPLGTLRIFWDDTAPPPPSQLSIPNLTPTNAPWQGSQNSFDTVNIGANIIGIGSYAFYDCSNLERVIAPDVEEIGAHAFDNCASLTAINMTVDMPAVQAIGDFAFENCSELKTLNFPDTLVNIGFGAFVGCRQLETFTFPDEVYTGGPLGNDHFIVDAPGVLIGLNASRVPTRIIKAPTGIATYSIPGTIVTIEPYAFAFSNLTSIVIPANVQDIGHDAFSDSLNLKEAEFEGDAPRHVPEWPWGEKMFENVATGFQILYLPNRSGWPTPPATNWRGYSAIAKSSYITLNRETVVLEVASTIQLRATVHPLNANQSVTWKSDNEDVATVTADGVVLAIKAGMANITATSLDGRESRSARVDVVNRLVPVTSVALDNTNLTINMGETRRLTAVVYPVNATNKNLIWTSSNNSVAYLVAESNDPDFQRIIVPARPGTATITVRTEDGNRVATCTVTVVAAPTFIPVSSIAISTTTIATGATISLGGTVHPANATNAFMRSGDLVSDVPNITWRIDEQNNNVDAIFTPGGELFVPMGRVGTVTVIATVYKGLADSGEPWRFPADADFVQRFTINVIPFLPVIDITGVPTLGYTGIPLQLMGTVEPAGASHRDIEWSMGEINTAVARLDTNTGVLLAQSPGMVSVVATIKNGIMSGTALGEFSRIFMVRIDPYTTNRLELIANTGGRVSGAGAGMFAGGEVIHITATPDTGYVFSGWHSSNGGEFANENSAETQFTMPAGETRVNAFFTYIGLPAAGAGGLGGGGVILPTPVHYFTSSGVYARHSGESFGHVTIRDFTLFSSVSLNGRQLTRNSHYTATRLGGFTEIILANGYLDSLNPGSHSLTVHFRDNISVNAVFTVVWPNQVSTYFDDVSSSNWFSESVAFVSDRGWMTSHPTQPRQFRASAPVTQGEVIDAFYRMAGNPSIMNANGQVLQGRSAAHEWVRANGIIPLGGVFNLDSPISRQDIALLFGRFVTAMRLTYPVNQPMPSFSDEWQIEQVARPAVISLFRAGVIGGRTENTFVPLGNMTRAEMAAVLQRFATTVGRW